MHKLRLPIALLWLVLLAAYAVTSHAAPDSATYQLRLIVNVEGTTLPITVAARFGSNPTPYRLQAAGNSYSISATTTASGAVVILLRGGTEMRHDAVRWQARPCGQTTVAVLYQPDALGGLRLVGMAQADGILAQLTPEGYTPQAATGNVAAGTDNMTADPAQAGGANPPIGGGSDDAPAGFVAPNGGLPEASPAMPEPPTGTVTATHTIAATPTLQAAISPTPTGKLAGKQASPATGGGINWWLVIFGAALVAAGFYAPKYLASSGSSDEVAGVTATAEVGGQTS